MSRLFVYLLAVLFPPIGTFYWAGPDPSLLSINTILTFLLSVPALILMYSYNSGALTSIHYLCSYIFIFPGSIHACWIISTDDIKPSDPSLNPSRTPPLLEPTPQRVASVYQSMANTPMMEAIITPMEESIKLERSPPMIVNPNIQYADIRQGQSPFA